MGWGEEHRRQIFLKPQKPTHSCGKLNLYYYLPSAGD